MVRSAVIRRFQRLMKFVSRNTSRPRSAHSTPASEGVSRLEAQRKREGIAPTVKFEPDPPGPGEEMIVPAPSWKVIQKGALKYQPTQKSPCIEESPGLWSSWRCCFARHSPARNLDLDPVGVGEVNPVAFAPGLQSGGFQLLLGLLGRIARDGVAIVIQAGLIPLE